MRKFIIIGILTLLVACDSDDDILSENYEDGEVEFLFDNAGPEGITMIFIGDGYTELSLKRESGHYRNDAIRYFDHLFSIEPFKSYKEHFNAVIIYTESETSSIKEGNTTGTNTALGAYYYRPYNSTIKRFSADNSKIANYKNKLPSAYLNNSNVLIVLNAQDRGNACFKCDIGYSGNKSVGTMVHEVGHSFAGLGDEYEYSGRSPASVNGRPNLDNTSSVDSLKWKKFLDKPGYNDVGAFEGGGYVSTGIWRPEDTSIMRSSDNAPFFNAPSREAIVKRILRLRKIPFRFEDFLNYDVLPNKNKNTLVKEVTEVNCGNIHSD